MSFYSLNAVKNPNPWSRSLTRALFFELVNSTFKPFAMYSLKNEDITREVQLEENGPFVTKVFPSLYLKYMETDDPTEWRFANEYFSGWEHWEEVSTNNAIAPYVERWRKELDLRTKSQALARIKAEAKSGSKEALAASKYLIARGWDDKPQNKRGRPSKEDINKAANEIAYNEKRFDEDLDAVSKIIQSKQVG